MRGRNWTQIGIRGEWFCSTESSSVVSLLKRFCLDNRKPLGVVVATIVLVVLISFLTRSGAPDIETVSVSGIVSLNGQPLSNIFVSFEPALDGSSSGKVMAQPGSFGITNEDGRYQLKWRHGTGAVSGTHRVILVWRDPEREDTVPDAAPGEMKDGDDVQLESEPVFLLPESARDGSLRITVPETGTDSADFAF